MSAPNLITIEIGNVDASTITLTYSEPVQANNYADGWTLTKNGDPLPILATQQVSPVTVYFTVSECQSTDTLTATYITPPAYSDPSRTAYIMNWTSPDFRG